MASACSAVVTELPKGVFMTTTPCSVAASISTLSTADPGAAHHLEPGRGTQQIGRDLVDERMAMPSILADDGLLLGGRGGPA
jgi:hypothetical protein